MSARKRGRIKMPWQITFISEINGAKIVIDHKTDPRNLTQAVTVGNAIDSYNASLEKTRKDQMNSIKYWQDVGGWRPNIEVHGAD